MLRAKAAHPNLAILRDEHSIAPNVGVGAKRAIGEAVRTHGRGIFLDEVGARGQGHGERIKDEGQRIKEERLNLRNWWAIAARKIAKFPIFYSLVFSLYPCPVARARGFA